MQFIKPFTTRQAAGHFDRYFEKIHARRPNRPLQIKVSSPKQGLDYSFPADSTNQSYHIASIGKLFTAALVQLLGERGLMDVHTPVMRYLEPAVLERLFVFQGHDYAGQATVEHLLGHTSGVADYFEGGTTGGQSFLDGVLSNPQVHWTPGKLLDFSRERQSAVGVPGQVFNYSDTGYILLGLIIESATGKSFAQNLHDEFFGPLRMDDSYLLFYSEPLNTPKQTLENIWIKDTEVSGYPSLSCDWAGGGIVSTTADLLKFNQALHAGRLVQKSTLQTMAAGSRKFRPGIYYGLGMMEIRFGDFFFLLGRLPKASGHIGILATHLFFDPMTDTHIAMNFGDTARMVESFKALIEIENVLQRIK